MKSKNKNVQKLFLDNFSSGVIVFDPILFKFNKNNIISRINEKINLNTMESIFFDFNSKKIVNETISSLDKLKIALKTNGYTVHCTAV